MCYFWVTLPSSILLLVFLISLCCSIATQRQMHACNAAAFCLVVCCARRSTSPTQRQSRSTNVSFSPVKNKNLFRYWVLGEWVIPTSLGNHSTIDTKHWSFVRKIVAFLSERGPIGFYSLLRPIVRLLTSSTIDIEAKCLIIFRVIRQPSAVSKQQTLIISTDGAGSRAVYFVLCSLSVTV